MTSHSQTAAIQLHQVTALAGRLITLAVGPKNTGTADPRFLSWGTETETDSEKEHSIGVKRQWKGIEANRRPEFGNGTLHPAELIV